MTNDCRESTGSVDRSQGISGRISEALRESGVSWARSVKASQPNAAALPFETSGAARTTLLNRIHSLGWDQDTPSVAPVAFAPS